MKYLFLILLGLNFALVGLGSAAADKVSVYVCDPGSLVIHGLQSPCVQAKDLKKRVAPVEVNIRGNSATMRAHIIGFDRGARAGDPREAANYDRLKLQVFSARGKKVAKSPWVISTGRVYQVYHGFDTAADLTFYFSNRHVIAKTKFGSAKHRDLIYGLIDPKGALGLFQGATVPTSKIIEGSYTNFILHGQGDHQKLYTKWTKSQSDPFAFTRIAGDPPSLLGVARARRYGVFPRGTDKQILQALALLCSFIQVNPYLAAPAHVGAAKRAHAMGRKCRSNILSRLQNAVIRRSRNIYYLNDTIFPVSRREVVVAALDLMLAEDSFKFHPWAQPMIDGSVYMAHRKMPGEPNLDLMQKLLDLLGAPPLGTSPHSNFSPDSEILAKGRKVFERLSFRKSGESAAEAKMLELDRRFYKRTLIRELGKLTNFYAGKARTNWSDNSIRLAASLLCTNSWGLASDMIPFMKSLFGAVHTEVIARNVGVLLGLINQTADEETRTQLREQLDKHHKRRKYLLKYPNDERYRRELALIDDFLDGIKNANTRELCR